MAVGLVEAEEEAARDAVVVHDRLELLERPDHPVDVVAEMGVRVEDVRARGQLGAQLRLEAGEELAVPGRAARSPSESTHVAYSNAGASTRSRKTRSGTAPSHCGTPLTTIRGTDQTSIESASDGNSVASIAAERTRGEASAALYASSTAGGQCGQVGVTKTSIARSRSSAASRSSDSGRSDDSRGPPRARRRSASRARSPTGVRSSAARRPRPPAARRSPDSARSRRAPPRRDTSRGRRARRGRTRRAASRLAKSSRARREAASPPARARRAARRGVRARRRSSRTCASSSGRKIDIERTIGSAPWPTS